MMRYLLILATIAILAASDEEIRIIVEEPERYIKTINVGWGGEFVPEGKREETIQSEYNKIIVELVREARLSKYNRILIRKQELEESGGMIRLKVKVTFYEVIQ